MIVVVAATSSEAHEAAQALGLVGWVEAGDEDELAFDPEGDLVDSIVYVDGWRSSGWLTVDSVSWLALITGAKETEVGAIGRPDLAEVRARLAAVELDGDRRERAAHRAARSRMGISPEAMADAIETGQ